MLCRLANIFGWQIGFDYDGKHVCHLCDKKKNVDQSLLSYCHSCIFFPGKGKKDDEWSDEDSDIELKEVSEDEIAKPVSKKKSKISLR